MYTVEFEPRHSIIVSMDESDLFEDVEVSIYDNGTVQIRQFEDMMGDYNVVYISYQQLLDIFSAMSSTEGLFKVEMRRSR